MMQKAMECDERQTQDNPDAIEEHRQGERSGDRDPREDIWHCIGGVPWSRC